MDMWRLPSKRRPSMGRVHMALIAQTRPARVGGAVGRLGDGAFGLSMTLDSLEVARSRLMFVREEEKTVYGSIQVCEAEGLRGLEGRMLVLVHTLSAAQLDEADEQRFLGELQLLQSLRHENVLGLLGVCTSSRPILGVLECGELGRLSDVVGGTALAEVQLLQMSLDVAKGMEYLAGRRVVHRALSCQHCYVRADMQVMVAGVFSRVVQDKEYYQANATFFGLRSLAPECLTALRFDVRSDVYAFGVLLFQVFARMATPHASLTDNQLLETVRLQRRLPGLEEQLPAGGHVNANVRGGVKAVVRDCCGQEPGSRPSFTAVVSR